MNGQNVAVSYGVGGDVYDGGSGAAGPEQVEVVEGLEGGLGHPDGAHVHLGDALVRLVPPLPDTKVLRFHTTPFT